MRSRTNSKAARFCAAMGSAGSEGALSGSIGLPLRQSRKSRCGPVEAPVLPTYPISWPCDTRDPLRDTLGETAQVQVTAHHIARVLDFQRISAAASPAFEGYHAVGYGTDGSPLRRGVVDTVVRAVDLVDRVQACVGETGTDARIFERCFEQLLAQTAAVDVPVLDAVVLTERNGVVVLAGMGEFGAPDATDADGRRVDDPLVVDHREGVAFLDAEEVDAPLVDLFQFGGQRIGHLLAHDGAPQRTVDRGLFLLTADADRVFRRA